jgi:hypothetical protein
VSYSTAHAELRLLERASLARGRRVGNALIYEAARTQEIAGAVEALVRASAATSATADIEPGRIVATLAALGAPVHAAASPMDDLAPEEAIARGLRLTHADPALARAYPVLLARNRHRLNMERLKQRATELDQKPTLGFFLELTAALANDRRLRAVAHTLKDRRVRKVRDFFDGARGRYSRQLAAERTPRIARDWHFRMNMDLENFRQLYVKFCA